jgi:hypothetical protein
VVDEYLQGNGWGVWEQLSEHHFHCSAWWLFGKRMCFNIRRFLWATLRFHHWPLWCSRSFLLPMKDSLIYRHHHRGKEYQYSASLITMTTLCTSCHLPMWHTLQMDSCFLCMLGQVGSLRVLAILSLL